MYKAEYNRRTLKSFDILEAETTKGPLKKGYQVLSMYKGDTDEAESQGQEVAMFSGIARDHRRTLKSFDILEAKIPHIPLKKGYQVLSMYKGDIDEANSQGQERHHQGP